MPLNRNESSGQATLSFKNHEAFIKKNHHLSRECATAFTQIAINENIQLVPEFVLKDTDKRPLKLIETTSQEPVKECNLVIGKTVSLAGITDNEDIEKDARFLNELRKVFDSFETSRQFTSARQQIETAYQNARTTLKKGIKNEV